MFSLWRNLWLGVLVVAHSLSGSDAEGAAICVEVRVATSASGWGLGQVYWRQGGSGSWNTGGGTTVAGGYISGTASMLDVNLTGLQMYISAPLSGITHNSEIATSVTAAGSCGYRMTAPGSLPSTPPTSWTISGSYTNNSDYMRTITVDDGSGNPTEVELAPGEVYNLALGRGTAPTQPVTLTISGPNGADQPGYYAFSVIQTNQWRTDIGTGGSGTTGGGAIAPGGGVSTDTTSSSSPSISFGTSTGTASESSLKTGLSAVRTSVSEGSSAIGAAIDKLRRAISGDVPQATVDSAQSKATATNATGKANGVVVDFTSVLPTPTIGTRPSVGFQVMGETIPLFNFEDTTVATALTMMRGVIAAGLILGFLTFAYQAGLSSLQPVLLTPSQGAASNVPFASSATALAMAAGVCAVFAAAIAGINYLIVHGLASGVADAMAAGATDVSGTVGTWRGALATFWAQSWVPNAFAFADSVMPMTLLFALATAMPILEISVAAIAAGAMGAIRFFVG